VNHGNAQSNNPQQRAKRLEFDRFKAEATMVDVVNVGDNDELPSAPSDNYGRGGTFTKKK
jgi:hypothetical protein